MASLYDPTYKWYANAADLLADTPVLISAQDRIGNQIFKGEFLTGRYGGCLSGELETTANFLTFVRRGWWVLVYSNPANDPIWVGRVRTLVERNRRGTVRLLGPIHYFNGTLRASPATVGAPLETIILDMALEMARVNRAIPNAFVPNAFLSGHFPNWTPTAAGDFTSVPLSSRRDFATEAATIAGATDSLFYGFFPGPRKIWIDNEKYLTDNYAESPTSTPLDFQIARGIPFRRRFFRERDNLIFTIRKDEPEEPFNRVVLAGTDRVDTWVAQDLDRLATEPVVSVWARKEGIASDAQGQRIAEEILAWGASREGYAEATLIHNALPDAPGNLVERPLWPWSDRPVVKDSLGVRVVSQGLVSTVKTTLADSPSQSVQIGRSSRDIKAFFGLTSFEKNPSQDKFAFPGILPWESPVGYSSSFEIPDPPVAFFTRPIYGRGSSRREEITHVLPASIFRYKDFQIVAGRDRGIVAGERKHTLITRRRRYNTDAQGPGYAYTLGALDYFEIARTLRWADPLTIPFWRDGVTREWRGLATIFENGEPLSFDELLKRSASFLWTDYRVDSIVPSLDSLLAKLRFGQITSSDIRRLQRSTVALSPNSLQQGYIVDPNPGGFDDPEDGWVPINDGDGKNYEDFHFVPYSLLLHLGSNQHGRLADADATAANANWDYLLSHYGGDGGIYSVESVFFPYEMTVPVPSPLPRPQGAVGATLRYPVDRIQSDEAESSRKVIVYMTLEGADTARALGYLWLEYFQFAKDQNSWNESDNPPLHAHNMGNFGVFTKRHTEQGVVHDEALSVPMDLPRLLTLYDIPQHPVLAPFQGDKVRYYTGPDGYGSKIARANEFLNESNADKEKMNLRDPSFFRIQLRRRKWTFSSLKIAPPDVYMGDSPVATYPPPIRMRRWKVRGFDDDYENTY